MTVLQIKDLPASTGLTGTELLEIQLAAGGPGSSQYATALMIASLVKWGMVSGSLTEQADLAAALAARVLTSELGIANGVATLASDGTLNSDQIPSALLGQVDYQGTWDASSGTAPSTSPAKGQYWIVTTAGTTSLDGITAWNVGDWAIYDTRWDKVNNTDAVSSVAGLTGVVSVASLQAALGLGSAAYAAAAAFASAAQGLLAASALQPDAGGQLQVTARRRKVSELGNITGAVTIDLASADIITATMVGSCTFSFANLPPAGYVADIELRLTQDATGSRTATWPSSGAWPGSSVFALTQAAAALDVVGLSVDSDGNWIGYPVEDVG